MTDKEKAPIGNVVKKHIDANRGGSLIAVEAMNLFPDFPGLKSFYFIINEPQITKPRGGHYHKVKHEVMFAIKGVIKLTLRKGNENSSIVLENRPEDSTILVVYIPPGWWHEVEFLNEDAVLGVLASVNYEDTIKNHDDIREIP